MVEEGSPWDTRQEIYEAPINPMDLADNEYNKQNHNKANGRRYTKLAEIKKLKTK